MKTDRNLFVDVNGQWRTNTYIPAYFRCYPFCLAQIESAKTPEAKQIVCVQSDRLTPGTTPLFDADGKPTVHWQPRFKLLESVEHARHQTRAFIQQLEALNLFEPFDAIAMPRGSGQYRLKGMLRIDEEKLSALTAKKIQTLTKQGYLRAIYAHLISLENFGRLMDMHQSVH